MDDASTYARQMARVHGRCTGSLFFSIFGGVWLLLALNYSHHFHWYAVLGVALLVFDFVVRALSLKKQVGTQADNAYPKAEKERNDRQFLILNAVTYGAVFLLFAVLPKLNASNYVFPAFVFLVGLHFLPMPPLYRHRANTMTGLFMMLWAVFCVAMFHADGEREAAWVTLGAGLALWASATIALTTASSLLHAHGGMTKEAS